MKHIEQIAAQNQLQAWGIIKDASLVEIWRDAGATINLVGLPENEKRLIICRL